jgi:hypothetical protein
MVDNIANVTMFLSLTLTSALGFIKDYSRAWQIWDIIAFVMAKKDFFAH